MGPRHKKVTESVLLQSINSLLLVLSERKFPVLGVFARTTLSTDNLICLRMDLEMR